MSRRCFFDFVFVGDAKDCSASFAGEESQVLNRRSRQTGLIGKQTANVITIENLVDESQICFTPVRRSITEQKQVGRIAGRNPIGRSESLRRRIKIGRSFESQLLAIDDQLPHVLRRIRNVFFLPIMVLHVEEQHSELIKRIAIVIQRRTEQIEPHVELVRATA